MDGVPETPALSQVVGWNARELRGSVTADELATVARRWGLNWGTGRISDLEAGRVSPTVPTLIALAEALGAVRGEPITLADLTRYDGYVSLTKELIVSGDVVPRLLSGDPVEIEAREVLGGLEHLEAAARAVREHIEYMESINPKLSDVSFGAITDVQRRSGEAEDRMAKVLGVERFVVDYASAYLWQQTVADERDLRAGEGASAQKRGRITRQLQAELKAVLDGG
jgi:hypothetical protein